MDEWRAGVKDRIRSVAVDCVADDLRMDTINGAPVIADAHHAVGEVRLDIGDAFRTKGLLTIPRPPSDIYDVVRRVVFLQRPGKILRRQKM